MRIPIILILLLVSNYSFANTIKFCSWNIANLGKSKSTTELAIIAALIKDFDLIAIQELVASDEGPYAVRKIVKALNNENNQWLYTISSSTTSDNPQENERYAYIFKKQKIKLLEKKELSFEYKTNITKEPYVVTFTSGKDTFTTVNFHAVPKKKNPQREIKYLQYFPTFFRTKNLIFLADFNCSDNDEVFNPLKKMGYRFALIGQKTTLKNECEYGNCLANALDNIMFHNNYWQLIDKGILPHYQLFNYDMKQARHLSDHTAVFATLKSKR